jgi:hypothetical protein
MIIPEVVLIQLSSWGWAQSCSKHVEDSNKRIIEEIVRQVGYPPELYEDAWSEKYKKNSEYCLVAKQYNLVWKNSQQILVLLTLWGPLYAGPGRSYLCHRSINNDTEHTQVKFMRKGMWKKTPITTVFQGY